jgi:hypothetical protein
VNLKGLQAHVGQGVLKDSAAIIKPKKLILKNDKSIFIMKGCNGVSSEKSSMAEFFCYLSKVRESFESESDLSTQITKDF